MEAHLTLAVLRRCALLLLHRYSHCFVSLVCPCCYETSCWRIRLISGGYYYIGVAMAPTGHPAGATSALGNSANGVNLDRWLGCDEFGWSFYARDDRTRSAAGHDGEPGTESGPHLQPGDVVTMIYDSDAGTLSARLQRGDHSDRPLGVMHDCPHLREAIKMSRAATGSEQRLHVALGVSSRTALELLPGVPTASVLPAPSKPPDAALDADATGVRGDVTAVWHPEHPEHNLVWIDGLDEYYCDVCTAQDLVRPIPTSLAVPMRLWSFLHNAGAPPWIAC